MEESIAFAKKYLENILSFFGLNVDVYATHDDEVISLSVPSTHMNGFLIGNHGDTMRSLQSLVITALRNQNFEFTRVTVDIADYKKQRQEHLLEQAKAWVEEVKSTNKPLELRPMNPADRRAVHQFATDYGLQTESRGEGRERHVVLMPGEQLSVDDEGQKDEKTAE